MQRRQTKESKDKHTSELESNASYPQFVDLVRVGEDLLEVDDILVPQAGQNLHLSQGSLTVGLERERISAFKVKL